MAEEPINNLQDSGDEPPVEEPGIDDDSPDTQPEQFDAEKFEQRIYSGVGRIVKKQLEENVLPHIQQRQPQYTPQNGDSDPIKKFNQDLYNEAFVNENMVGAFDRYLEIKNRAQKTVEQQNEHKLKQALVKHSEDPYYKDIYEDMEREARTIMARDNAPPEFAAEHAFYKARNKFLETSRDNGTGPQRMLSGGKKPPKEKGWTKELPGPLETAYQRDKGKGLFKDRKDYVKYLSPQVKAQFGLDG